MEALKKSLWSGEQGGAKKAAKKAKKFSVIEPFCM